MLPTQNVSVGAPPENQASLDVIMCDISCQHGCEQRPAGGVGGGDASYSLITENTSILQKSEYNPYILTPIRFQFIVNFFLVSGTSKGKTSGSSRS